MDPVMELATVTVSYLWAWHDLFKDDTWFPQHVPPEPVRPDLVTLVRAAGGDYATLFRLRELTARWPDERWDRQNAAGGAGRDKADIEDVIRGCRDQIDAGTLTWRARPSVRWAIREFSKIDGDPSLEAEVQLQLVATYARDMEKIADLLHVEDDKAFTPDLTREALTSLVAHRLLERSLLSKMAIALDYRPMLMRHDDSLGADQLDDPEYPARLIEHCRAHNEAIPFAFVQHEELVEIERSRAARYAAVGSVRAEQRFRASSGDEPIATADDDPAPAASVTSARPPLHIDRPAGNELLGLCFSGGGIRSATFNLGVLQALATRGWLPRVDYLSTVSGGGYIGAWLLAWIKRRGSIASVQESLRAIDARPARHRRHPFINADPADPHVRPIRFLREYSNYLAPMAGFFTADTWTMLSTWVRNTVLNLLVLAFSLMALLIAPRLGAHLPLMFGSPFWPAAWAVALLLAAALLIGLNLRSFEGKLQPNVTNPSRGDSTLVIALTIVLPLFLGASCASAALWMYPPDVDVPASLPLAMGVWPQLQAAGRTAMDVIVAPVFYVSALYCLTGLFLTVLVSNYGVRPVRHRRSVEEEWLVRLGGASWKALRTLFFSGALASVLGGLAALLISRLIVPWLWEDTQRGIWLSVAFGPLVVLLGLASVIVLYVGLEGTRVPDERREWWSRLGALMGLVGLGWALLACISFFAPLWVAQLGLYANAVGLGWATVTAVGARLASSGHSNGTTLSFDRNVLTAGLIKAAPFVFVVGLLVLLSVGAHALLGALQARRVLVGPDFTVFDLPPFQLERYVETYWAMLEPRSVAPLVVALVLCVAAALLAWRVDVNEFSMHHFYRNRLVRAYLGASRSPHHRWPNAFTGFDLDDDIKLWRFTTRDPSVKNDAASDCQRGFVGPYPIINAALNTSGGEDLAWQERKARSFVFTPLYCGFDFSSRQPSLPERVQAEFAYRPTTHFGSTGDDPGLGIGTAIAISGAAANPNAGCHTSPAVAFLLTVFNARLGWWMGNPRLSRWNKSSPSFGLFYLLSELFGFANTGRKYVNLSDGGHFENLGLYELVRRRCMYIVVCDAEQDQTYSLQGLGNAIRKCRVDFGVAIAWEPGDIEAVTPDPETKLSRSHIAVGRILYPGIREEGRILYLKSSIGGHDEPPDVLEYRKRFPDFPHQSTGDQFFDEGQFESYRALGQHIGEQLPRLRWPADSPGSEPLADLFERCAIRNRAALAGRPS